MLVFVFKVLFSFIYLFFLLQTILVEVCFYIPWVVLMDQWTVNWGNGLTVCDTVCTEKEMIKRSLRKMNVNTSYLIICD